MAIDHSIAALIDHTLLKPEATAAEIRKVCEEARKYGCASVCVNSYWVPVVAHELAGSPVKVCSVVGFPLGASATSSKVHETQIAVKEGAEEIDMVLNIGLLKSATAADYEAVKQDIRGVVELAHGAGAIVKVILETCLLSYEEKLRASELSLSAGADFIKTSTGFSTGGATVDDIAMMRGVAGSRAGVKASGGVRTVEDAVKMAQAGANRIGASASVAIVTGKGDGKSKGY